MGYAVAKNNAYAVFTRLSDLNPVAVCAERDKLEPDGIPFLRFDSEAHRLFHEWRAALEQKVRSGTEHPAIESHLAKYRSLVPALALLSYLADAAWVRLVVPRFSAPSGGPGISKATRAVFTPQSSIRISLPRKRSPRKS